MKKLTFMFAVVALMVCGSGGAAQDTLPGPNLLPPPGQLFPTPPDEVQPTERDLPPTIARTEGRRTQGQKTFDRQLQICRDC